MTWIQSSTVFAGESYADEMSSRIPGRERTSRMASGVEGHRLLRPEHVRAVAARALDHRHVREDRGEGPEVLLELGLGAAVGDPLHHDPARCQVGLPGLVVLVRRDHRGARALDRRRRVGEDDVELLGRELEVVAAVGDDHPPVRVGEDVGGVVVVAAEHRRARDGHELDDVGCRPAISAAAERGAHAEGDDERPRRIRPRDERQDRHELGVDGQQGHRGARDPELRRRADLAGLDRGDLVLGRGEDASRPRESM